jgi:starvation-inducible DNA-binding protein
VHELLDTLVADAQEWADLAAERIVALGLPIDARISTVAANTKATPLSDGFVQSDRSIAEVIGQIDVALEAVNTAVRELDELDQTSQDVAIEIARGLDKDRWLLFAHIAK